MRTRSAVALVFALLFLFFLLEEFAFRVTWHGPPDHGTCAAWLAVWAICTYKGPYKWKYWPCYALDIIWIGTIVIVGMYIAGVDFTSLGTRELLPALVLHSVNLACALLFAPDLKWSFIFPRRRPCAANRMVSPGS